MKITIEIPGGKYCEGCPCLGLNGKEEEHCGFWNKPLDYKGSKALRYELCLDMEKMLKRERGAGNE